MGSRRTIITLPEEDKGWLKSYGKAHDVSVAEAIRRSIRKLREDTSSETYKIMVKKTRGLWKKGDGLRYQNEIRSEWHQQKYQRF